MIHLVLNAIHQHQRFRKFLQDIRYVVLHNFQMERKQLCRQFYMNYWQLVRQQKKQMGKETDPFMKKILDKKQLYIKVTANSLYGQTGAKTSTFYEMDVAASTTATGRKLLIYAREIIENVYANMSIDTKYGPMITNAEYVYGDTDSVFFTC